MSKNPYKDELDRVRLTEESKSRLISRLAAPDEPPAPVRRRLPRMAVCALAASAALLTVGAGIAFSSTLRDYWGAESAPVYDENRQLLGRSATKNGWKLTLTDCICDANTAYIGFTVEAPEDAQLPPTTEYLPGVEATNYWFDGWSVKPSDGGQGDVSGSSIETLPDNDPDDNVFPYAIWMNLFNDPEVDPKGFNNRAYEITLGAFHRVGEWSDEPQKVFGVMREDGWYEDIVEQPDGWTLRNVKIACPDATKHTEVGVTVPYLDGETTFVSADLSPLSLTLHFEGGALYGHHQRNLADARDGLCSVVPPTTIYLQDGTSIVFDEYGTFDGIPHHYAGGGGGCDQDGGAMHSIIRFDRLIDPETVDHITMGGVTFEFD